MVVFDIANVSISDCSNKDPYNFLPDRVLHRTAVPPYRQLPYFIIHTNIIYTHARKRGTPNRHDTGKNDGKDTVCRRNVLSLLPERGWLDAVIQDKKAMNTGNFCRHEVITFRHFLRKGYALFAALGREVRIGVLTAATLTAAAPCLAQASAERPAGNAVTATSPGDTIELEEAEVLATAAATRLADPATATVQVLTREAVTSAGVSSINDLLKLATGTDVRQRGGFGMQTDISIDGGTFDQVALFVNGFPVNNPQTGHNAADFPLNLLDIERVEVLAGAATSVFGSQAFSGAVNVITRTRPSLTETGDGRRLALDGGLAFGSHGTMMTEVRAAAVPHPAWSTSLSAGYRRSDGAVENSDYRSGKVFWQGRTRMKDVTLSAQAGIALSNFGANTFYSAAYPDQWEATRRFHAGVRAETAGSIRFVPEFSWMRNADHFQLVRRSATGENYHRGDVYAGGIRAYAPWRSRNTSLSGTLSMGAELRHEDIFSSNLGRPMDEAQRFSHYTRRDGRTNVALTLGHTLRWHRWSADASLAAQRNSSTGRGMRFYPGVNLAFMPRVQRGTLRLTASWQRTLRLPTFTDLYYKSPTLEGNRNLRPEENNGVRMGAEWRTHAWSVTIQTFLNHGTNMIDWVLRTPEDQMYHATSFTLNNMGGSLTLLADLQQLLGKRQPLRRATLSYAYMHQHRCHGNEQVFKSNYA